MLPSIAVGLESASAACAQPPGRSSSSSRPEKPGPSAGKRCWKEQDQGARATGPTEGMEKPIVTPGRRPPARRPGEKPGQKPAAGSFRLADAAAHALQNAAGPPGRSARHHLVSTTTSRCRGGAAGLELGARASRFRAPRVTPAPASPGGGNPCVAGGSVSRQGLDRSPFQPVDERGLS